MKKRNLLLAGDWHLTETVLCFTEILFLSMEKSLIL